MARLHDTDGSGGITIDNKVVHLRRTNSTSTGDSANLNFTHNTTQGDPRKTDGTVENDTTVDIRNDSSLNLGNDIHHSSNIFGGQQMVYTSYKPATSIFANESSTATLVLSAEGEYIEVDGGSMRPVRNATTKVFTPTAITTLTIGDVDSPGSKGSDKAAGFVSYNENIVYYTKMNPSANPKTQTLTLSTAK